MGKKKQTGDIYAIKVLKKKQIYEQDHKERIITERNIMALTSHHDCFANMYYSFKDTKNLYLVMEYINGGGKKNEKQLKFKK